MRNIWLIGLIVILGVLLSCNTTAITHGVSTTASTKRYEVVNRSFGNWFDAKTEAERRGGYLAAINSREEQVLIENMIARDGNKDTYWIGGYCGNDRVWQWVTGERFEYSNWMQGEPNNSCGIEDKIVILRIPHPDVRSSRFGQWNDVPANWNIAGYRDNIVNVGYIIEWD